MLLPCLPCCLLSIWIEMHVARRLVPADKRGLCGRWAREANLASYFMMAAVLAVLLLVVGMWRARGISA